MKTQLIALALCAALIFSFSVLNGQEYLVTVDPSTGVHSKTLAIASAHSIQVVPGHSTFDKVQGRYFFKGLDWGGVEKLYIINAKTTATNRETVIPVNTAFSQIGNLQFDDSTGTVYCTGLHLASNTVFLLKMDTMTAAISTVAALPNIGNAETNQSCYDQNTHRYMMIGKDPMSAGGTTRYLNINAMTGSVIANVPNGIGAFECSMRWNNVTKKLYAFSNPIPMFSIFKLLIEFDPITATRIATVASTPTLGTIPLIWQSLTHPNMATIDELNNRYTIAIPMGPDNNGVLSYSLCTISLATGSLILKPFFPQGLNVAGENVMELYYDNKNGPLYALHWKFTNNPIGIRERVASEQFRSYPNPCSGSITLNSPPDYQHAEVVCFDATGKLVRSLNFHSGEKIQVDLSGESAGYYTLEITFDGKVATQKIIKVD